MVNFYYLLNNTTVSLKQKEIQYNYFRVGICICECLYMRTFSMHRFHYSYINNKRVNVSLLFLRLPFETCQTSTVAKLVFYSHFCY